jgi:SH3 domain-containing YSC84-like protein 1
MSNSGVSVDFRREAEERAVKLKKDKENAISLANQVQKDAASPQHKKYQYTNAMLSDEYGEDLNDTATAAKLAEVDYRLNGGRARSNTGEFIPPRWIPDEEVTNCHKCHSEFDWINRKHHCRHCGLVFCSECTLSKALLPVAFGLRDPQRVCEICENILRPYQVQLTHTIANHQCTNTIDVEGHCSARYFNLPYANDLAGEIRKAAYATYNLFNTDFISDKAIPGQLLKGARGLAFLTVLKAGVFMAPRVGTGLVVAKLPNGTWSAPTAISTVGCSWGFLAGADVTDYVVILNTPEAVEAFSGEGSVSIGAGISVAVGPLGRDLSGTFNVGVNGFAPAYSYSHSRGVFAGVGLEGSLIVSRTSCNFNFYGREVEPEAILRGDIPAPRAAQPLYDALYHSSGASTTDTRYTESYSATNTGDIVEGRKAAGFTPVLSPMKNYNSTPHKFSNAPKNSNTPAATGNDASGFYDTDEFGEVDLEDSVYEGVNGETQHYDEVSAMVKAGMF